MNLSTLIFILFALCKPDDIECKNKKLSCVEKFQGQISNESIVFQCQKK